MLDKTTENTDVVVKPVQDGAPAIFVRYSAAVGKDRNIELSFGIPLDMRPADLNKYLDKVTGCVNRQNEIGLLEFAKSTLMEAYNKITENSEAASAYEAKQESDWYSKGKLGAWKPTGSQQAEIKNYNTTIANYRDNIIPLWEKKVAELERKIAGEE